MRVRYLVVWAVLPLARSVSFAGHQSVSIRADGVVYFRINSVPYQAHHHADFLRSWVLGESFRRSARTRGAS